MTRLPFTFETETEKRIGADPAWQHGVQWGTPRPGHLEGKVMYHIADVLANIDTQPMTLDERRALRLVALVHDTFKYRVDLTRPRVGENHHGAIARRFAERYIDDPVILQLIQWHDDAYHCWRRGAYRDRWEEAERCADELIARLGPALPQYLRFFRADNRTESKEQAPLHWFEQVLRARGHDIDHEVPVSVYAPSGDQAEGASDLCARREEDELVGHERVEDAIAEVIYRMATPEDCATLAALRWETEVERHGIGGDQAQYEQYIATYVAELRAEFERGAYHAWLAEAAGEAVACVLLASWVMPPRLDGSRRRRGFVTSVYTRPAYRRQGIARRLMQSLIAYARDAGVERLILWASDAGRPLYEDLGFTASRGLEINL